MSNSTVPPMTSIYGDHGIALPENVQMAVVGVVTIGLFIGLIAEIATAEILFFIALTILMLTEILTLTEVLAGFSNEALITIGALFLVVGAVERSHCVEHVVRQIFGNAESSLEMSKMKLFVMCFCLSMFLNNTPLVALLLPVVKDWGRMRNIPASQLLMPLSFAVLSGSFGTMIGTSTNLTINGLLSASKGFEFPFFAPAPIGIMIAPILFIYMIVCGPSLLPNRSGLLRSVRDHTSDLIAEVFVSKESIFVGQSVGKMIQRLGLSPNQIIKIRRVIDITNSDSNGMPASVGTNQEGEDGEEEDEEKDGETLLMTEALHANDKIPVSDGKYTSKSSRYWYAPQVTSARSPSNSIDVDSINDIEAGMAQKRNENRYQSADVTTRFNDIVAPSPSDTICAGDIVFITSAAVLIKKVLKSIAGEAKGLELLSSNVLDLPGYGTELAELVISNESPFLGKNVANVSNEFAERYGAAIITFRPREYAPGVLKPNTTRYSSPTSPSLDGIELSTISDQANGHGYENENLPTDRVSPHDKPMAISSIVGASGIDISAQSTPPAMVERRSHRHANGLASISSTPSIEQSESHHDDEDLLLDPAKYDGAAAHEIEVGDVILAVVSLTELPNLTANKEFFAVSTVGKIPTPVTPYSFVPVVLFFVVLIVVALGYLNMCAASLLLVAIYFALGFLTTNDIRTMIDIKLMVLMGCSLSFATGMSSSGLSAAIAGVIVHLNAGPMVGLFLVYILTAILTILVTNNAAAALMLPIAVSMADLMDLSFKPFAMAVLIASTATFMSPIGYQTHVMVWGPGGYSFSDFMIFGAIPTVIYILGGCLLCVFLYPF